MRRALTFETLWNSAPCQALCIALAGALGSVAIYSDLAAGRIGVNALCGAAIVIGLVLAALKDALTGASGCASPLETTAVRPSSRSGQHDA